MFSWWDCGRETETRGDGERRTEKGFGSKTSSGRCGQQTYPESKESWVERWLSGDCSSDSTGVLGTVVGEHQWKNDLKIVVHCGY